MNFKTDNDKMIQTIEDALAVIELGVSDDDILNKVCLIPESVFQSLSSSDIQLALHANKSHLAFSMDSGVVGVVDLSTKAVLRMKTKHESVSL